MIVGYCCGKLFTRYELSQRKKILLWLGVGVLLFFVTLRFTNLYGDPFPWSVQKNNLYTLLSFVNVQKYPPSLLYLSLTIGVAFVFLALVKKEGSGLSKIIIVYGRVPFFYYIIHFFLLQLINISLFLARGHSAAEGMAGEPGIPFKFAIPGEGFDLPGVYLIWIVVVVALYPVCKWYDRYKTNHREKWWLSYL